MPDKYTKHTESAIRELLESRGCDDCWQLTYADMLAKGLEPVPCLDENLSITDLREIARPVYHRKFCIVMDLAREVMDLREQLEVAERAGEIR